jgi:prephenate dehydrogenase
MTSTAPERVAIVGTGLIGTSIAMAAARVGSTVSGWDADADTLGLAAERTGLREARSLEDAVVRADIVVVCSPVPSIPELVAHALAVAPMAIVTDAGSIKGPVVRDVASLAGADAARFIGGHPMGGSERSGPEHASASLVDGIVWVLTPDGGAEAEAEAVASLEAWIQRIGGRPMRMSAERHDRLVAFVSHLPQIASTALMGLAATEEADEPDILLLAAGGFRDLTRLASSNPALWSQILLSNRDAIAEAIDLFSARLADLRAMVVEGRGRDVEETFDDAKRARLRLAAKPQVRAGVAVLQVQAPDRPGALAELTAVLAEHSVNIEDLQIVHSPEGGRGTVHLTVAATSVDDALRVLASRSFDPIRLA